MRPVPALPAAVRRFAGSLRFRLLAGAAVWVTLALALAGLLLADLFRTHVRARFEAELTTHLDQLTAALERGPDGAPLVRIPLSDPRFRRPLSGLYWQVEGGSGEALRSRSLWDRALALPPDQLADGVIHTHRTTGPEGQRLTVRERTVVLPDGVPLRLAVAGDEAELTAAEDGFNRTLALSLLVLAAVLIGAALVQVQVGLSPLTRLGRQLAEIRRGRARRLPGGMPAEVSPLVDDLNAVLDHNEEVVTRARIQAGNLAHALKTSLAVLGNEADGLTPGTAATIGPRIAGQVAVMTRHIDHHMARARAAASSGVPGVATPLPDAVARLVRTLERLYDHRALDIAADVPPDAVFRGDRQDFEEMLGNLLDNACKWAARSVRVTVRRKDPGRLELRVEDDGPGLPADQRRKVLAPGIRLDESVPGSGLGLAIVQDLATLYGGALRLEPAPSGGLLAVLELPAIDR